MKRQVEKVLWCVKWEEVTTGMRLVSRFGFTNLKYSPYRFFTIFLAILHRDMKDEIIVVLVWRKKGWKWKYTYITEVNIKNDKSTGINRFEMSACVLKLEKFVAYPSIWHAKQKQISMLHVVAHILVAVLAKWLYVLNVWYFYSYPEWCLRWKHHRTCILALVGRLISKFNVISSG